MSVYTFAVNSVIRGYHEYKTVWESPADGEVLRCEREVGNSHDTYAVAVKKLIDGHYVVVGHVPRKISSICSIFIRRGGTIHGTVNGHRQYSADLPQGGMEIPCVLTFTATCSSEAEKTKKLIQSSLSTESVKVNTEDVSVSKAVESVAVVEDEFEDTIHAPSPPRSPQDVTVGSVDLTEGDVSPVRKKQKVCDILVERIIMGEELTDETINHAQQLLKSKYQQFNGFQSTLLQGKKMALTDTQIRNKVQIIHCSRRNHWIAATTVNCKEGEVKIYDSVFNSCDEETKLVVRNLFQADTAKQSPHIKVMHCQKQTGSKDCGLFSIGFATAIVLGLNPGKIMFLQPVMRAHLVNCFNKGEMVMFPYK